LLLAGAIAAVAALFLLDTGREATHPPEPAAVREFGPPGAGRVPAPGPRVAGNRVRSSRNDLGWWLVTDVVHSTNYGRYRGLELGYRIHLVQEGERLQGHGEKWTENGRPIPAERRTPISLEGRMSDRRADARFVERGSRRPTAGEFRWEISPERGRLSGSFSSEAAASTGSSTGHKLD
jgi:hypothetical protein